MAAMAPKTASRPKIRSAPDLVYKEGLAALLAASMAMVFSSLMDAPTQGPPDPSASASPSIKAPWIFIGIQFMLKFIHPLVAGVLIPFIVLLVVASMPFLHFGSRLKNLLFFLALLLAVVCSLFGYVW